MNTELFNQAKQAAGAKDYITALNAYTQCLQDPENVPAPGEVGLIYHQIGNCLMRSKNVNEALNAYAQSLNDEMYDNAGTVHYNMGQAYAIVRDQDNAVLHYKAAVADGKYATPYKAYTALGSSYLKSGRSAEAGVAFREAALDSSNPDPSKALLNLGICFMALDRPADAVASYESALPFDTDNETKNKIYANLGQAYVSTGQMKKAVAAFESALRDKTYFLSDSAAVDYQKAIGQVAMGTEEMQPVQIDLGAQAEAEAMDGSDDALAGLDVSADGTAVLDPAVYDQQYDDYDDYLPQEQAYGIQLPQDQNYFNAEQQSAEWEKNMRRAAKKRHPVLKFFLVLLILVIILAGAAVVLYSQGYGYPTQSSVVTELFKSPESSKTTAYVSGLSDEKIASFTDMIVQDNNVTIDGVNQSMNESTVYATATTSNNGKVTYKISMSRDQIGWKVADVQLYFTSQNS